MANTARAPLFVEARSRRGKRHRDVVLYRPSPGAQPPVPPSVAMPFRWQEDFEPLRRRVVTDEFLATVFYQPNSVTLTLAGEAAAFTAGLPAAAFALNLAGEAATFASGAVGFGNVQTLLGGAATFASGAIAPSQALDLVGVASTSAAGSLGLGSSLGLAGVAAAFSVGALQPELSIGLPGQSAAFAIGSVTAVTNVGISVTLTGHHAAFSTGALAPAASSVLAGEAAAFGSGTITADANSILTVSLTGNAAAFESGYLVNATWLNVIGESAAFAAGSVGTGALFGYATVVALSQTGVQSTETAYPAGTACLVLGSWYNLMGLPFVPTTLQYRIDDVVSGTNIVPWTSLVPASSNQVTVTAAQNYMVSLTRQSEQHQVLFEITDFYGNVSYADVVYDLVRTGVS